MLFLFFVRILTFQCILYLYIFRIFSQRITFGWFLMYIIITRNHGLRMLQTMIYFNHNFPIFHQSCRRTQYNAYDCVKSYYYLLKIIYSNITRDQSSGQYRKSSYVITIIIVQLLTVTRGSYMLTIQLVRARKRFALSFTQYTPTLTIAFRVHDNCFCQYRTPSK